jgi:eukaryotic-like serine/threonine-protein kinase
MRIGLRTLVLALVIAPTIEPVGAQPSRMFRGDPAHTGVVASSLFSGQGGIRWRAQTGGPVRSSPAVTSQRVFVGSDDGFLYALNRQSGAVVWKFASGGRVAASPALVNNLVVAATLAGRVFAVNQSTGTLAWSFTTGPALPPNTDFAGGWDFLASSPVVVGNRVLIGGGDGVLYAVNAADGVIRWRARTGGRIRATPAVDSGLVVVGAWDGRVYAFDLTTGAERWVHRTAGDTLDSRKAGFDRRAIQSSAAISGGGVFVGSRDGALYGLDLKTGERRFRATHRGSWVVASPAVHDGVACVGSSDGHFFHCVDGLTGADRWRVNTGSNLLSSPVIVNGLILVGTHHTNAPRGELLALDAANGQVRWRVELDEATDSSPVVDGNDVFIGTNSGSVFAITESNARVPRMAVFYDSSLVIQPFAAGARMAFEYFREAGYEPLDARTMAVFMDDRIRDGQPSAVVLAMDIVPPTVAPVLADTVLIRRYLNVGGKVVSFSAPLGTALRDSAGRIQGDDPSALPKLLGTPPDAIDYEQEFARPTADGRKWGLTQSVRGDYGMKPGTMSIPLAVDPLGRATAWVKTFRPDLPGTGYVQLWGLGASIERLPMIRAVAEYGLLRPAR